MFESEQDLRCSLERLPAAGRGPVGLVTVGDDFWIVLSDDDDPLLDALTEPTMSATAAMCVGHAVDADGCLRIRKLDPERVALIAEILGRS